MNTSARRLAVVVIDEDESKRRSIRRALEARGYRVFERETPLGATREIVHFQLDAVIIDLEMPVMRGDAFAALLRRNTHLDHVAIILLAPSPAEALRSADTSCADGMYAKDQPVDGLVALLERVCARRAASLASARRLAEVAELRRPSRPIDASEPQA